MVITHFTVRRSARARRARVTLTDDAQVIVVLPARAPEGLAADLVRGHAHWIARHQARLLEAQHILDARPALGEGRAIPLRGLPHDVFVERRRPALNAPPSRSKFIRRRRSSFAGRLSTTVQSWTSSSVAAPRGQA